MFGGHASRRDDARGARGAAAQPSLYARIGAFLDAQRLAPDPANYAFAHAILSAPDSPLAKAVADLTDGGVRLSLRDIETLGVDVSTAAPDAAARADGIVAQTQMQVDGFADVVHDLWAETGGFGRDLAEKVAAIREARAAVSGDLHAIEDIVALTGAMVERVHSAEAQLEQATRETAELRAKLDEARDNARRDPLTDLPNRRAFEEAFAAQSAIGATLHLAVCDVDHFKTINDRFGHAVGDRVLKAIGAVLAESCAGHFVARYGGEEFVVLFAGIDGAAAAAILETARAAVEAKRYKLRESDAPLGAVTFSAGLSNAQAGDSARGLFQRADTLLYRAKSEGRNCVVAG